MLIFCFRRFVLSVESHSHTHSFFSVSKRNYYSRQYRSSSFDNQNHRNEDYDKEEASSNQGSPYAGMTLGAALALFAMTTDKVKAEGENYFDIDSPSL